jgi:hypothetical protein
MAGDDMVADDIMLLGIDRKVLGNLHPSAPDVHEYEVAISSYSCGGRLTVLN